MALNSTKTRSDASAQGTIYDDLPFHGEHVAVEAPPPVEIREFPYQFSILHLLMLMTLVGLVFTLIFLMGMSNGLRLCVLLSAIVLYFYPYYLEWNADRRLR